MPEISGCSEIAMFSLLHNICFYFWLAASLLLSSRISGYEHAKDNGDIYLVNETKLMERKSMTTEATSEADIDFDELMKTCNASFSIPMDYLVQFNATGELPDVMDKTGMCYIRCMYEKSGLIEDWKLNTGKIRRYMWPATGDSIEQCEVHGKSEMNACVRTYMIARCLMMRTIVDARNNPMDS